MKIELTGIEPEEFEPPAGFKDEPISFTYFGLLNGQRPGSAMEVYFDDVVLNGKEFHFDSDPAWEGSGNHVTFEDHEPGGVQQYGYQASSFAGGKSGEIGGVIWNTEVKRSFYGDHVGPFSLEDRLECVGDSDDAGGWGGFAGVFRGFNSESLKSGEGGGELHRGECGGADADWALLSAERDWE